MHTKCSNLEPGLFQSKAPVTVREFGDRYTLIGPLNPKTVAHEVEALEPASSYLKAALNTLSSYGVKYHYGRWLIEGAPHVLLFDLASVWERLSRWKRYFWNMLNASASDEDVEANNAVSFGYVVAWFFDEVGVPPGLSQGGAGFAAMCRLPNQDFCKIQSAFLHLPPLWLAAAGLILAAKRRLELATIFTAHATVLGRHLSASGVDLYGNLQNFDCEKEATDGGIYRRYRIEYLATQCADCFTTVSNITGYEAENLLKRSPDCILPSGLNIANVMTHVRGGGGGDPGPCYRSKKGQRCLTLDFGRVFYS
ncbi:MAG: glycogen synthase [Olpidium bornovanus]|uniref:Glycogen [starch] synthase n=1 Tax=Olpidium bornovanus TaxID=278681 RepID=A0A8H7ZMA6_9FUNG|nr:MAG: glycogen synthase [Olpidium bornovanus]